MSIPRSYLLLLLSMFEDAPREVCLRHKTWMTIKKPNVELFGAPSSKLSESAVFVGDIKSENCLFVVLQKLISCTRQPNALKYLWLAQFLRHPRLRSMSQNRKPRICHKFLMLRSVFCCLSRNVTRSPSIGMNCSWRVGTLFRENVLQSFEKENCSPLKLNSESLRFLITKGKIIFWENENHEAIKIFTTLSFQLKFSVIISRSKILMILLKCMKFETLMLRSWKTRAWDGSSCHSALEWFIEICVKSCPLQLEVPN